jgi:ABC-type glutathione transport system ATPase component
MSIDPQKAPVLRVCGLRKFYSRRAAIWQKSTKVFAVNGVDFELAAGQTLALVGSSGSGKSTVARCISRLERPSGGQIWLDEKEISGVRGSLLRSVRTRIQLIFQDPASSMNPRFSAAEAIEEPVVIQERGTREQRRERSKDLMNQVGLSPTWADRSVMQFSGGQRQRIAIARALASEPKVLVLDEAFSSLDLSTQAQIANLLLNLQAAYSLAYLLISHDLSLVTKIADGIAVMSQGKIVECGTASAILSQPSHPETKKLTASWFKSQSHTTFTAKAGANP